MKLDEIAKAFGLDPNTLEQIKTELSKDAEPVAYMNPYGGVVTAKYMEHASGLEKNTFNVPLYTHPQPVEATERRVANACAAKLEKDAYDLAIEHGYEDMGLISFGRGEHAEAKFGRYNELLELAEFFRQGKWKEFVK